MATIRRSLDLTPTGPPVNIISFEEFLKVRPDFFTVVNGQFFRHDPKQVNVCDRSEGRAALFPDSMGGCLLVANEMELERLTQKLLQLPLFFTVDLKRLYKSGNTNYTFRSTAAVVVNSQHPHIQQHFKGLLNEAMEYMRQGKSFAVEFDFNLIFEDWLEMQTGRTDPYNTVYRSQHGIVTVTNSGEHSSWFSCKNCPTVCYLWTLCLPCCMVAYPIYKIQRKLRVVDLGGRVRGVQATVFTSQVTRDEVNQVLNAVARNVVNRLATDMVEPTITQPTAGQPPAFSAVQQQPRGPVHEQPAQIMYGNPAPRV